MFCFVVFSNCTNEDDLDMKQMQAEEEEEGRKGKIAGKSLNVDDIDQLDKDIIYVSNSGKSSEKISNTNSSHKGFIAN